MPSQYALLLIDLINDFEFEHGDALLSYALPAAKQIKKLKQTCKEQNIPVIYVNDNYGQWQSDFRHLVDHCQNHKVRGQPIAKLLTPEQDDFFILKPKFSGFFSTPLEILLQHLGVDHLIITGVAGNMCVLFTANDAYMRNYEIHVPSDCVASNDKIANESALDYMQQVLKAKISPSEHLIAEISKRGSR
ncbi:cysteine hydrolase family protein [Alkalihalobacterium bogoriense]|uniref:cysteine hydrolase family protein n=1 Tax=Alkalihalobacterium bogoriense TaxID=246272 RepID=UPI000B03EA0C|nr:isochorismatase family cysteine hydrolase [Alkalihalobacterium bogoriense]